MLVEHKGPEDLHWEDIVETDDEDQHFCEYRVALRKVIGMTPLRCRGRSPGCYEYTNMVVCYHGSGLADAMCPACIGENGNKRIRKALEAGKAVIFCIRRSGSC